jgi:probable F420-dependent oxidoreductase
MRAPPDDRIRSGGDGPRSRLPANAHTAPMNIGASLSMPWLAELGRLRDAVITLDQAGLHHVTTSGHVLTSAPERYPERPTPTYASVYRDPFVLFASLAPVTSQIRFRTSILILPMLPTAVVAKQAGDLSLLSAGRFDLGIGVSWQAAEYQALGQTLSGRARRMEEQIEVLRRLWSEPRVAFHGEFHDIDDLGIGQLPAASVPILIGCGTDEVPLRRAARLADGWLPIPAAAEEPVGRLRRYAEEAGRDPDEIAIAGRVVAGGHFVGLAEGQCAAGATELTIAASPAAELTEGIDAIVAGAQQLRAAGF